MKKLLVPIDGSEGATLALSRAKELGKDLAAEIIVLHVVPQAHTSYVGEEAEIFKQTMDRGNETMATKILEAAKAQMADYPYGVSYEKLAGDAAYQTVKYAEENGVDTIVMGSRGLGALSRTFLGSISHKVLNMAHTSVYIVK